MNRSFIQIYALMVCFTTLMCGVIALGVGLYDLVQIAAPAFTIYGHQAYQSNDRYFVAYPENRNLPKAERTKIRAAALRDALAAERRTAMQSMVFVSIICLINAVIFAVHWQIARRSGWRPSEASGQARRLPE